MFSEINVSLEPWQVKK